MVARDQKVRLTGQCQGQQERVVGVTQGAFKTKIKLSRYAGTADISVIAGSAKG